MPTNKFKQAVDAVPVIKGGYRAGLQAMARNSKYVAADDNKLIDGSVDIDESVKELYPTAPRWDYALGYGGRAYFVEVHPASSTGSVDEVIKKAQWLRQWLSSKAAPLNAIASGKNVYWVHTGKCAILNSSRYKRQLAQSNIVLANTLKLRLG